ncbi:MAG: hypothetical protein BGP12_00235 [Rhodospirillales bacterium 70-18]|nr:MAG: hypothetical protein BGP12_00235 [Rhodospirillales bacterium 70-18]
MAIMMPGSIGHYFKDDLADMPATEPRGPGLFARLGAGLAFIASLPRRRAVLNELYSLSEHELADIGLTRAELPLVFDADFAAKRREARPANQNARQPNGRPLAA